MTPISAPGPAVPPGCDTITGCLLHHATATPERRFVHLVAKGVETEISYGALLAQARGFAGLYRAQGVEPGDVVLLFLRTHPLMYAAFFGAMLAGAVPSYMPCPSAKQDADRYWRDHATLVARIEPRCVMTDPAMAPGLRAAGLLGPEVALLTLDDLPDTAPPEPPDLPAFRPGDMSRALPGDVALLQHSSGTTGLKKGVMLTHAAILAQTRALSAALGATAADVVATWLPVYHDMGLISSTVIPAVLGQQVVAMDPFEWSADPAAFLRLIARHRATLAWMPNFAFDHIVNASSGSETFDLRSVRALIACSEPIYGSTLTRFQARFAEAGVTPRMLQASYGLAESVFAVTQSDPSRPPVRLVLSGESLRRRRRAERAQPGKAAVPMVGNGAALPGNTVLILDPSGAAVPDGHVGEIVVEGPSVFDGYFRQAETTRTMLRNGRIHSRDEGFLWQGELYVLGRLDDRIIVHGRNLYASEVETVLARVPGMKPGRAVALGVESAGVGSQELVVVAETDQAGEGALALRRALKAAVVQALGFAPREVRLVEYGWLSKTTSGKINRGLNKARYLEGARR